MVTKLTAEDISFIQNIPSERITKLETSVRNLYYLVIINIILTMISIGISHPIVDKIMGVLFGVF